MRREHRDELLRSCLAINALLRGELRDVRNALKARRQEEKHNPNWRLQPRAPRGTAEGGQWTDGGAAPQPDKIASGPKSGDPMDGDDAATLGGMLNFERTRGRYTQALEATQDSRQRARIANDRAMLARQTFGSFSGEEEEKIYLEEMRTRRGPSALGDTDLSDRAFRFRQAGNVGDGRNVAVFEYRDRGGVLRYIERASDGGPHAEALVVAELRRLRIRPEDVTRIYTDRQPCREWCRRLLRPYTRARITWVVNWPDGRDGRRDAEAELARQLRRYRQMESQDSLPMRLWRHPNPAGNARRPRRRRR